jgi:hypothetical protein
LNGGGDGGLAIAVPTVRDRVARLAPAARSTFLFRIHYPLQRRMHGPLSRHIVQMAGSQWYASQPSLMSCLRRVVEPVSGADTPAHGYIDERCTPKVNSKDSAVDQRIATNPTRDEFRVALGAVHNATA